MAEVVTIGDATLYHGDCLEILPTLEYGVVVTDPPYGMHKAVWDMRIPPWLPLVGAAPTACFCGVVGMRDYPSPDWVGAWVRQGSTQRIGSLKGFNNWEPILFYNMPALDNDVIACPNYHEDTGHPTTKPVPLMRRVVGKMPAGVVIDPFMGSGTTGLACAELSRTFIGIEIERRYFDIACERIDNAYRQQRMFA
jgi:site-specific DNA-methyltransferase (adenine-specific)